MTPSSTCETTQPIGYDGIRSNRRRSAAGAAARRSTTAGSTRPALQTTRGRVQRAEAPAQRARRPGRQKPARADAEPRCRSRCAMGFLLISISAMWIGSQSSSNCSRYSAVSISCAPRLLLLEQHEVLEHQRVHVRRHEAAVGVLRRADDRLAADVEAGVDDDRAAGLLLEALEQPVVAAVPLGVDGLDARRVVDVRDRRDARARHLELVDAAAARRPSPFGDDALAPRAPARRAACTGCPRRAASRSTRARAPRRTDGANGRNDSRNLIFRFITDCIAWLRASPRMLRLPSARGPNSIRPWNQPTTFSVGDQIGDVRRTARFVRRMRW